MTVYKINDKMDAEKIYYVFEDEMKMNDLKLCPNRTEPTSLQFPHKGSAGLPRPAGIILANKHSSFYVTHICSAIDGHPCYPDGTIYTVEYYH